MENQIGNIVFGYLFRWQGLSIYQGNMVDAASVEVVYHIYKAGKEVLLDDEPAPYTDIYFSDIFKVCFDKEKGFVLQKNENIAELFSILLGYDDYSAEVVKCTLECHKPLEPGAVRGDMPEEYRYEVKASNVELSEGKFRNFMLENADIHCLIPGAQAQVGMAKIVPVD